MGGFECTTLSNSSPLCSCHTHNDKHSALQLLSICRCYREAQEWLEDFAAALQDCICPHAVSVVSAAQTFLGSSPKPLNPPDNKLDKCLPGVPGKRDSRDLSRHALPVAELSQVMLLEVVAHMDLYGKVAHIGLTMTIECKLI